jgi:hypothetical protein
MFERVSELNEAYVRARDECCMCVCVCVCVERERERERERCSRASCSNVTYLLSAPEMHRSSLLEIFQDCS